jgi:hypothetical protein
MKRCFSLAITLAATLTAVLGLARMGAATEPLDVTTSESSLSSSRRASETRGVLPTAFRR